VLTLFTGSPFFPGGLGTFTALQNQYLTFEEGPTQNVELQWGTYFDASDQAAISRRMGSIHPWYDDYPARIMASQIGQRAYATALEYYDPQSGGTGGGGAASAIEVVGAGKGAAGSTGAAAKGGPTGDQAPDPHDEGVAAPTEPTRRGPRAVLRARPDR
jgi:hypothetical protein